MSERETIERVKAPVTTASLARDLRALGLAPGMTVLVHTSLSALGWVCGGPVALLQSLIDVLTPQGTLVMPAHSGDFSDPGEWVNPPVPQAWWPAIRESMPAYDPRLTPTRGMGRAAELFRTWPGVLRSNHPHSSFAAWGRHAAEITADHPLEYSLGEGTPLARIYALDGWVLLLGVGHGNNTSFHLAEVRAGVRPVVRHGAPVMVDGQRTWQAFDEPDYDDEPFPAIGADYERNGAVRIGRVGAGEARLFRQRPAVDFAAEWLRARPVPPPV